MAADGEGRQRRGRRWALGLAVVVLGTVGVLDRQVVIGFRDRRWREPVVFYGAPRVLTVGMDPERAGIVEHLRRRGYREVADSPLAVGSFRSSPSALEFVARPAPLADRYRDRAAVRVSATLEAGRIREIRVGDRGEERVDRFALEPPTLGGVLDGTWSRGEAVDLAVVPRHVVDAAVAAEDARFFRHHGLDPPSILRALRVNWSAGRIRQGGSTITQQVVKNQFLSQERSFLRKAREALLSILLELHFSKQEILECYLETVYLGHDGLRPIRGFADGARTFFGKPLAELSIAQAAMLAGIIRAPNPSSPLRHPRQALRRRTQVLEQMLGMRALTLEEAGRAQAEPFAPPARRIPSAVETRFMRHVQATLGGLGGGAGDLRPGSAVFTTLDPDLQAILAEEVAAWVAEHRRGPLARAEVAALALDPASGAVRASIGGADRASDELDRATSARRPIGSLVKPFLFLRAVADPQIALTVIDSLSDAPLELTLGDEVWRPQNADRSYRGEVSVRTALEESRNLPAVRLLQRVGVGELATLLEDLELPAEGSTVPRVPSLALGTLGSSLLRVTAAYDIFPRGGTWVAPGFVDSVKSPAGAVLWARPISSRRIAAAAPTYVVHSMLEGVVRRGTARRLAGLAGQVAIAGKTGTTDDFRDAWFVGYTPSLVVGVWIGFDDAHSLGASAADLAVPLWGRIVARASAGEAPESLPIPAGVDVVDVDVATRLRAAPGCGEKTREPFVHGTAPVRSCRANAARETEAAPATPWWREIDERLRHALRWLLGDAVADGATAPVPYPPERCGFAGAGLTSYCS